MFLPSCSVHRDLDIGMHLGTLQRIVGQLTFVLQSGLCSLGFQLDFRLLLLDGTSHNFLAEPKKKIRSQHGKLKF